MTCCQQRSSLKCVSLGSNSSFVPFCVLQNRDILIFFNFLPELKIQPPIFLLQSQVTPIVPIIWLASTSRVQFTGFFPCQLLGPISSCLLAPGRAFSLSPPGTRTLAKHRLSFFVLQIHNPRNKFQDTLFGKKTLWPAFIKVIKYFRSYFCA